MSDALLLKLIGGRGSSRGTALHGTKLPLDKWRRAATLLAAGGPRVRLRELQAACGVSHKTAWRMRSLLSDAAQALAEQGSGQSEQA